MDLIDIIDRADELSRGVVRHWIDEALMKPDIRRQILNDAFSFSPPSVGPPSHMKPRDGGPILILGPGGDFTEEIYG